MSAGSCLRGGTLGRWGAQGGGSKKNYIMVMWHIKSTGMTSRTEWKKCFHPRVKLVTLEVRSKGKISSNLDYHVNSKIFIPIFVCVLTNKILKTYWTEFWLCCWGHDPGVGLWGAGWIKNFSVGICDGTPSTVHSSSNLFSMYLFLRYWAKTERWSQ